MQTLVEQAYKRRRAATCPTEEECKGHNDMVNAMMEGIAEMQETCRAMAETVNHIVEDVADIQENCRAMAETVDRIVHKDVAEE